MIAWLRLSSMLQVLLIACLLFAIGVAATLSVNSVNNHIDNTIKTTVAQAEAQGSNVQAQNIKKLETAIQQFVQVVTDECHTIESLGGKCPVVNITVNLQ